MKRKTIIITGRVVADPEVRYTVDERPVAIFDVLVAGRTGKANPRSFKVRAYNGLAKICGEYLKAGRLVAIEGKMKSGLKAGTEILEAGNIQMLERRC